MDVLEYEKTSFESLFDAESLPEALKELLLNTAELAKMSSAARAYSIEHQGATKKILAALEHQNFTLN